MINFMYVYSFIISIEHLCRVLWRICAESLWRLGKRTRVDEVHDVFHIKLHTQFLVLAVCSKRSAQKSVLVITLVFGRVVRFMMSGLR